MRMWNVPTAWMCRQHLLGEHVEMHMFTGAIMKGSDLAGYIEHGLVVPRQIPTRHTQLAEELVRRGYHHKSPLRNIPHDMQLPVGSVDTRKNVAELMRRCPECRDRIEERCSIKI